MQQHRYTVHCLDVWGNAEDGYEVVTISSDATDYQILQTLVKAGIIDSLFNMGDIEVNDDGGTPPTIYIDYQGRPEYELRYLDTIDCCKP